MDKVRAERGLYLRFRGWLREDGVFTPAIGWETGRVTQREHGAPEYSLELVDRDGEVIVEISPRVDAGDCVRLGGAMGTSQVTGYLPYRPEGTVVRFRRGTRVLYERAVHGAPPEVAVRYARVEGDSLRLEWTSTHPVPVVYNVAIVQERRGVTLVHHTTETAASIPLERIPFGGECHAFVLATDGLRSASGGSEAFELPPRPPHVTIGSPLPDEPVSEAEGVSLSGHAMTPDGRSLPDEGLRWLIDGVEVARGTRTEWVSPLGRGRHTVALRWGDHPPTEVVITVRPRNDAEQDWEEAVAELLASQGGETACRPENGSPHSHESGG